MSFQSRSSTFVVFLCLSAAVAAAASPADSKLLPLVPEGAQFVAGVEDPQTPPANGWLLLLTRKTSLDLQDWIALSGVDPHRRADQIVEVATSSSGGEFKEHLVLLAGQFDRELIFRAAIRNGASVTEDSGQRVLLVKPFTREKDEMTDSRWMAILDNRVAVFGSPEQVRRVLQRYQSKSGPDPLLIQHLRELHSDVNSWNVLVMSAPMLARNVESEQMDAPWTHILDGADEFTFGIHYGSTDRIDIAVHADSDQNASRLAALLAEPGIIAADFSSNVLPRLQSFSIKQRDLRGSFLLRGKQVAHWFADFNALHSSVTNFQPSR